MKLKTYFLMTLFFVSYSALAQTYEVSGIVTNDYNDPLSAVSVSVKGTSLGTSSDLDGSYSLSVSNGDVLVYSFVGFNPKEVTMDGTSTVNVVLTGAYGLSNEPISVGTTNNSVTFIGVPAVNPNALEVLMLWAGDQNDLDLWITDDPPTTGLEASQTTTPIESVSFNNNAYPDGTYNILPRVWSAVDTNVEVTMYIVHPNGTIELFEDSVPGGVSQAWYYFVKFDKVTDSTTGDIIYTTTKLLAESVF